MRFSAIASFSAGVVLLGGAPVSAAKLAMEAPA